MADENAPGTRKLKASLATLAKADEAAIIEQGAEAIEDIGVAAEFIESVGLDRLELAITAIDDPALEDRGKRALETFHRFRNAAAGPNEPDENVDERFQFHRGRGTTINDDGEPSGE